MKNFLALIAMMFVCISAPAPAQADTPSEQINIWIKAKKDWLEYHLQYSRRACSSLTSPTKDLCEVTWNFVNDRIGAEEAALELWLEALKIETTAERSLIFEFLISSATFNAIQDDTNAMIKIAKILYPDNATSVPVIQVQNNALGTYAKEIRDRFKQDEALVKVITQYQDACTRLVGQNKIVCHGVSRYFSFRAIADQSRFELWRKTLTLHPESREYILILSVLTSGEKLDASHKETARMMEFAKAIYPRKIGSK